MSIEDIRRRPPRTVFLDRDGTINLKAVEGDYIRTPDRMVLLPRAAAAVARLNRAGVRTVLVTNQRWLSAPDADPSLFHATQARLTELLATEGARLDAAYVCPHAARFCRCRKPAPGMLRRAAEEQALDLRQSVMVGDALSDMEAGRAAGAGTILLGAPTTSPFADAVCPDLWSAAELVVNARS